MRDPLLEINFEETAEVERDREPVTFGMPVPMGLIMESSGLRMVDEEGNFVVTATMPLTKWVDGTIKWLLVDTQLSMPAKGKKRLTIYSGESGKETKEESSERPSPFELHKSNGKIFVRSGEFEFQLDARKLIPFSQVVVAGQPLLNENASQIMLTDDLDREWVPHIENWNVEIQNPLRMTLAFEGPFASDAAVHVLRYKCRVTFFAGRSFARIDFTIWNPNEARHPGGVWDLGDPGSIYFKDLSFNFALNSKEPSEILWKTQPSDPINSINSPKERRASPTNLHPVKSENHLTGATNLTIYQDSSGGENWRSNNHVNRHGKVPVTFKGFEVRKGNDTSSKGLRATPYVAVSNGQEVIATTIKKFWQNFPKAIESDNGTLTIRLFPKYFQSLFELQGGEQKTHTFYICADQEPVQDSFLDWVHEPLIPRVPSEWYHSSGACPRPVPIGSVNTDSYYIDYQKMVDIAIRGKRSFFARREIIDEYGWRNFGDIYADHEAVVHQGADEFVSHYNNQYDVIKGAVIQFMRTGERTWFQLADELAGHVSDIDIYHTAQDRYQYNNGMFWHTDHWVDAATSTHRTYSRKHREFKNSHFVGGGPALAHNYATGLLYHYWLTGETSSKDSVMALAGHVYGNLEGADTVAEICATLIKNTLKWIKEKTNPEETVYFEYFGLNGPSRSSGNSLNTLLDAYLISGDEKYINQAEDLIRRCVCPWDNIEDMGLLDAERRWMYVIFLQALGRYLDVKRDSEQLDPSFRYARAVLLRYAEWMLDNEYPYLEKPEILESPTETWAAQDLRKSDILAHSAGYAPDSLRQKLLNKSRFFFEVCIDQLRSLETRTFTRPIAILMTNGMVHMDVFSRSAHSEDIVSQHMDNALLNVDARFQKNGVLDRLIRFVKVAKNTSLRKELRWINLRLEGRILKYAHREKFLKR